MKVELEIDFEFEFELEFKLEFEIEFEIQTRNDRDNLLHVSFTLIISILSEAYN